MWPRRLQEPSVGCEDFRVALGEVRFNGRHRADILAEVGRSASWECQPLHRAIDDEQRRARGGAGGRLLDGFDSYAVSWCLGER